ncbi:hypothetical protein [Lysinibacillus sp. BPa_S21]|uniref:hypothetical protein n=1 Tax=Lysinibacillus sp. BPa_S21 TaxID=2932478 RepID=UPI00201220D6|nr:hypothetical protein [Lysinibacillus sp. BPa_S21]MCL1698008.1 hypothetical protein [Lysinibacillus sp. BPa_S21]
MKEVGRRKEHSKRRKKVSLMDRKAEIADRMVKSVNRKAKNVDRMVKVMDRISKTTKKVSLMDRKAEIADRKAKNVDRTTKIVDSPDKATKDRIAKVTNRAIDTRSAYIMSYPNIYVAPLIKEALLFLYLYSSDIEAIASISLLLIEVRKTFR